MRLSALPALLLPALALAEPAVHVRARTDLRIFEVRRTATAAMVRGRVVDPATGAGIAGQWVEIAEAGRPVGRVRGDENGDFTLAGPPGEVRISVPGDGDHEPSASLPLAVTRPGPTTAPATPSARPTTPRPAAARPPPPAAPPTPLAWFLAPTLATAAILLAALLLRLAPWRRWQAWRRGRTRGQRLRVSGALVAVDGGARLTLARADRTIAGVVLDGETGRTVAGRVTLEEPGARREATLDGGRFRFPDLPPGRPRLTVAAAAYLPASLDCVVPHAGQLRALRLSLTPIRRLLLDELLGALGDPAPAPAATPRELAHAAPPAAALAALLRLVEESYFSPRPASLASLDEARRLRGAIPAPAAPGA